MPRIFKGSESTLRLLISKTGDYQALTEIKIKLYTTDIENAIEIIDGIQVCKNIAIITLAPRAFMGMEDGLINYIIDGATEDDVFHTERQSNYMLKSLSYINEDGVATQTMTIESNGEYRVTPNDGLYVDINVNVPDLNGSYDDGFNVGYGQGKTDGANEQKGKLESINITENGTYTKEDGYNNIEVNVPDLNGSYDEGYAEGKTDGVNEQKSKLESINITENGTYSKEDGYNQIEVNVPDLNGSYNEGYAQGKTDGVSEQKSKLESISITENGTYTKEDGYNHIEVNVTDLNGSYEEGYEQGQADVAENARVLDVTENGNYLSKFSDPIVPIMPTLVTGVYDDGTEFHSYTELKDKIFNTKIAGSLDSRLEFWYKGDSKVTSGGEAIIIGSGNNDDSDCFRVRYTTYYNDRLRIEIGNSTVYIYDWDDTVWHHLIVSKAEGFWIDGEKRGDFSPTNTINGEFFINGISYGLYQNANGCYGMIKIDDVVIIPTADGFLNTNTGELLEVVYPGDYTFTENVIKYGEGELFKTINVNVPQKINLRQTGLKLGYSTFKEVPEWVDFDGVTDMTSMFSNCNNLETIPLIDTRYVTNASSMFSNCSNLKTLPNNFNFGKCNSMSKFFSSVRISDYSFLETWVINPNASMSEMINNTNTTYVPAIPCVGNLTYEQSAIFYSYSDYSELTYFGGWIGRKYNVNSNKILNKMPNLTYESCISILNNLYDFTGNGETPNSNQGQLKVHANFLTTVGDEISIGTNKGWTITV